MGELNRMGIEDVRVIWSFPTPYKRFVLSKIPHIHCLEEKPGYWGCTIAQYEAVKTAYHLGLNRVLIVEDDCRFLKDTSKVWANLRLAPENADVVLLDHIKEIGCRNLPEGVPFFACSKSFSTACYIVNRKAMERLIAMYESPVSGKYRKPLMRACDHFTDNSYLGRDIAICCASPLLAIQCECGDATNTGGTYIRDEYVKSGVVFDDYNTW